jgi:hypothetical protein
MRAGSLVALTGLVAAALLAWSPAAPGREAAVRTIDRTLLCTTLTDRDGRRRLGVTAVPKSGGETAALRTYLLGRGDDSYWPVVDVATPLWLYGGSQWVSLNTGDCRRVEHSFRLSPAGLLGAQAETRLVRCAVGRTLSIRVRATFSRWEGWTVQPARSRMPRSPRQLVAQGTMTTASMLVRTRGRPIVYALLTPSGSTRVITAPPPRCIRS